MKQASTEPTEPKVSEPKNKKKVPTKKAAKDPIKNKNVQSK